MITEDYIMTLFYIILALVVIGITVYFVTKKKGPRLPKKPEGPATPMPPSSTPSPPPPPEVPPGM